MAMPPLEEYRTGVYSIRHKATGKRYVGSAAGRGGLWGRLKSHKEALEQGTHRNRYLQRSWNKYGAKAFAFSILERCSPKRCVSREQWWMDHYQSYDPTKGYNICPTAGNMLGFKHRIGTRLRLGMLNSLRDQASREKQAAKIRGIPHSEDVKKKRSESLKRAYAEGRRKRGHSEETKRRIREGMKGKQARGERQGAAKLTDERVRWIRKVYRFGSKKYGQRGLAKILNVSQHAIRSILNGSTWRHVS